MRMRGHETNSGRHPHHGRNIRRFREMLGLKQEALAWEMGNEWSQKRISALEQREVIPYEILEQVSKALRIPTDVIQRFDEETAIRNLQTNFAYSSRTAAPVNHAEPTINRELPANFNPIEKWVSAIQENEKLYERLLKSEQEKVAMLQKMLDHTLENVRFGSAQALS